MGLSVIGLTNDQVVRGLLPTSPEYHHLLARARMVGVEDRQQLSLLLAGTM